MSKATLEYNRDWSKIFQLSEDSPSGLIRINSKHKDSIGFAGTKKYDSETGLPHCWTINFEGNHYLIHRLIIVMHNTYLPDDRIVDHVDGNPFNNSIENLRVTTQKENTQNKRKRSNKELTSGIVIEGDTRYRAMWMENGKQKSKSFSILKYGDVAAKQLAIDYRNAKILELNNNGESYTERHGK